MAFGGGVRPPTEGAPPLTISVRPSPMGLAVTWEMATTAEMARRTEENFIVLECLICLSELFGGSGEERRRRRIGSVG